MKNLKIVFGSFALAAALAVPLHAQTFLTKGLVAFYPFNGNANDASGFTNNPFTNTATLGADRFGVTNAAASFVSGQLIVYTNAPQIQAVTNLTVTYWVQTTNYFSGFHGIVSKADSSDNWDGFQVGFYHSHVQVQVDQSEFSSYARITDGNWHAVSVTFDNSNQVVNLYIDGQLDSTFDTPVAVLGVTDPLYLGVDRYAASFYAGALDEVRLFNRVLTPVEISQLYAVESAQFSQPYLNLAVAINASLQGSNSVSGGITNIPSVARTLATKDILAVLANDAHAEGSWPSNSFPKNTGLALAGHSLIVLNGTNLLLNVSDKLSFNTGSPVIKSGKISTVTSLPTPGTQTLQIAGITFDDTFAAGDYGLKFYLDGVLSLATMDTIPGATSGNYAQTLTLSFGTAAGDGYVQGIPFICTGTISASVKSALHF